MTTLEAFAFCFTCGVFTYGLVRNELALRALRRELLELENTVEARTAPIPIYPPMKTVQFGSYSAVQGAHCE